MKINSKTSGNDVEILSLIHSRVALSRAELVKLTGLSAGLISATVRRLITNGLVVESGLDGNAVWHTNHPLTGIERCDETDGRSSCDRAAFAARSLAQAGSADDLRDLLSDRTVPVVKASRTGGDGYTLWGVVAEHAVPPRVLASAGPPGATTWQPLEVVPYDRGAR